MKILLLEDTLESVSQAWNAEALLLLILEKDHDREQRLQKVIQETHRPGRIVEYLNISMVLKSLPDNITKKQKLFAVGSFINSIYPDAYSVETTLCPGFPGIRKESLYKNSRDIYNDNTSSLSAEIIHYYKSTFIDLCASIEVTPSDVFEAERIMEKIRVDTKDALEDIRECKKGPFKALSYILHNRNEESFIFKIN